MCANRSQFIIEVTEEQAELTEKISIIQVPAGSWSRTKSRFRQIGIYGDRFIFDSVIFDRGNKDFHLRLR